MLGGMVYFETKMAQPVEALLPMLGLGYLFNARMSPNAADAPIKIQKVLDSSDAMSSWRTSSGKHCTYLVEYAYLEWEH